MLEDIRIKRDARIPLVPFTDYFKGFERLEAVKAIFGRDASKILGRVRLEFYSGRRGYMGVHDDDGHIRVNALYLREGEIRGIYLDIIHELVHVRQHMEGKELFNEEFDYVDRPTEIEAYKVTVNEARRIGMNEREIFEYLKMDNMTKTNHRRLARHVGVKIP